MKFVATEKEPTIKSFLTSSCVRVTALLAVAVPFALVCGAARKVK